MTDYASMPGSCALSPPVLLSPFPLPLLFQCQVAPRVFLVLALPQRGLREKWGCSDRRQLQAGPAKARGEQKGAGCQDGSGPGTDSGGLRGKQGGWEGRPRPPPSAASSQEPPDPSCVCLPETAGVRHPLEPAERPQHTMAFTGDSVLRTPQSRVRSLIGAQPDDIRTGPGQHCSPQPPGYRQANRMQMAGSQGGQGGKSVSSLVPPAGPPSSVGAVPSGAWSWGTPGVHILQPPRSHPGPRPIFSMSPPQRPPEPQESLVAWCSLWLVPGQLHQQLLSAQAGSARVGHRDPDRGSKGNMGLGARRSRP